MNINTAALTAAILAEATNLQGQIDALAAKRDGLLSGTTVAPSVMPRPSSAAGSVTSGRRVMSPSAKAKIAAAQKARWSKIRGLRPQSAAGAATPGKRNMSDAGRKRIAKAQKLRWAKIHAAQASVAASTDAAPAAA